MYLYLLILLVSFRGAMHLSEGLTGLAEKSIEQTTETIINLALKTIEVHNIENE